jgi:hypothetical protein
MPSPIEAVVVRFGAEWTGGAVINRIANDLTRLVSSGKQVGDAFSQIGKMTGIQSHDRAIAQSAVTLLKYQTQITNAKSAIGALGQELASGAITTDDAASKYLSLANSIKVAEAGIASAVPAASSFIGTLASALPVILGAGAALVGAAKAFSEWREAAEEGAQVRQLGDSFGYLTTQIYGIPNLLGRMREAARGTISDVGLMSSYLTLTAGTSRELGQELSENAPRLLEIAKAANVLNPTLGDTTFFFDSLARGIKRSEIRLIDNLGLIIKVGQAQRTYAESIGVSVRELTAEQKQLAILNEVLRVGGNLIDQVGGKTDSLVDPYLQLAANTENVGNAFKEMASVTFEPVIGGLAQLTGGMADAFAAAQQTYGILQQIVELNAERTAGAEPLGASLGGGITQQAQVYRQAISSMIDARKDLQFWELKSKDLLDDTIVSTIAQSIGPLQNASVGVRQALKQMFGDSVQFAGQGQQAFAIITDGANTYRVALGHVTAAVQALTDAERERELSVRGGTFFVNQGLPIPQTNGRRLMREYVNSILPTDEELKRIEQQSIRASEEFDAAQTRMNKAMREGVAALHATMAETQAARQEIATGAWLELFAGGDFDSDLIVGDIRSVGDAWTYTTGATEEQQELIDDLNADLERARTKLWEMSQGIGIQGDKAESTAKKMEELTAEVANYERVIGEVSAGIQTVTTSGIAALNIDDAEVFRRVIDAFGASGHSVQNLNAIALGFGLIDQNAAEALLKVSALEGIITQLDVMVQAGDIDASQVPDAVRDAIKTLEGEGAFADIIAETEIKVNVARAEVNRELLLPEEDRTRQIDIGANLDPATRALAESQGLIERSQSAFKIDADDSPARSTLRDIVDDINSSSATLDIFGNFIPDPDMPGDGSPTPPGPPGPTPFQHGGYIPGGRGQMVAIRAHAGEFVMKPEAVDRLGVGFLASLNDGAVPSANNSVTVQTNFYAPVGGPREAREIVVRAGDDAAEQLLSILKRNGYSGVSR